ncbi:MAG: hypothetical protein U5L09_22990 [Bacteroidales bacterium]|nr:hypothetical protein [Bacteroidales bacterium]
MIESFNATYHDIETRSMVKVRLMATYFVLLISFILIVSMAAIIISSDLLQFLFDRGWIKDQITIWVVNISQISYYCCHRLFYSVGDILLCALQETAFQFFFAGGYFCHCPFCAHHPGI